MKLIGHAVADWAIVLNIYYLLTFPLAAVTALALFRHLGLSRLMALGLSLVFALQPYHFDRGQGHLMLAAYWHVPLMALGVFWLLRPAGLRDAEGVPLWRSWRCRLAFLFALLGVLGGHYYAFFSCLFYVTAGVYTALHTRRRSPLLEAGVLIAAIGLGGVLNLLPNVIFWASEGSNRAVSAKGPALSEQCSLRVTPMLLPHRHHRLSLLRGLTAAYDKQSPLPHVERQSSVGVIAGLGLIALCGIGLFGRRGDAPLHGLGVVVLAGLLVASVSGFGTLFAYLVSPQIHGYGRMTPYLALFGLAAAGLLAAPLARRPLILLPVLMLAVLDVLPAATEPDRPTARTQFDGARRFAAAVQEAVPAGTAVYQLPGSRFPLERYDYLDLYLFTRGLRLSAPAMINRPAATWQEEVELLPADLFLERIALTGFEALVIDRRVRCTPLMDAVEKLLTEESAPVIRGEKRAFFDLRPHIARLRQETGESRWERQVAVARCPVQVRAWSRFAPPEPGGRWCSSKHGWVEVVNASNRPIEVNFLLTLSHGPVRVTAPFLEAVVSGRLTQRVSVPPGRHTVMLRHLGQAAEQTKGGARWFRVERFTLHPATSEQEARR
jgi:phosphoglycerol transferase